MDISQWTMQGGIYTCTQVARIVSRAESKPWAAVKVMIPVKGQDNSILYVLYDLFHLDMERMDVEIDPEELKRRKAEKKERRKEKKRLAHEEIKRKFAKNKNHETSSSSSDEDDAEQMSRFANVIAMVEQVMMFLF